VHDNISTLNIIYSPVHLTEGDAQPSLSNLDWFAEYSYHKLLEVMQWWQTCVPANTINTDNFLTQLGLEFNALKLWRSG